jgi:hypothetical protein
MKGASEIHHINSLKRTEEAVEEMTFANVRFVWGIGALMNVQAEHFRLDKDI